MGEREQKKANVFWLLPRERKCVEKFVHWEMGSR